MNKYILLLLFIVFFLYPTFSFATSTYSAEGSYQWNTPTSATTVISTEEGLGDWLPAGNDTTYTTSGSWSTTISVPTTVSTETTNGYYDKSWRAVASNSTGTKLVAAINGGRLYTGVWNSTTSIYDWTERQVGSNSNKSWSTIASSYDATNNKDGTNIIAAALNGRLYTSVDSGANWTERKPLNIDADKNWTSVASDADGSFLVAAVNGGGLYTSSDYGATWTERYPPGGTSSTKTWSAVACNSDGTRIVAAINNGRLYTAKWNTSTLVYSWSEQRPAGDTDVQWTSVASSYSAAKNGTTIIAASFAGRIYKGVWGTTTFTWTEPTPSGSATNLNWNSVSVDNDATVIVAAVSGGKLYISKNSGIAGSWSIGTTDRYWSSVASDLDGSNLITAVMAGRLYTSSNSGSAWTEQTTGSTTFTWSAPTETAVMKVVFPDSVWGGTFHPGTTLYNFGPSGNVAADGKTLVLVCDNGFRSPVPGVFYIQSSYNNTISGTKDGIAVSGSGTPTIYPRTSDCQVGDGYVMQDGICIKGSAANCTVTGPTNVAKNGTVNFNVAYSNMGGTPTIASIGGTSPFPTGTTCGNGSTPTSSSCNASGCTMACTYNTAGSFAASTLIKNGTTYAGCETPIIVANGTCSPTDPNPSVTLGGTKIFNWNYSGMGTTGTVVFNSAPSCGDGAIVSNNPSCTASGTAGSGTCTLACSPYGTTTDSPFTVSANISNGSYLAICSNTITVVNNSAPTATELDTTPNTVTPNYCSNTVSFGWTYTDGDTPADDNTGFDIQISDSPSFTGDIITLSGTDLDYLSGTNNYQWTSANIKASPGIYDLSYGGTTAKTYYWRVKVYDATHPNAASILTWTNAPSSFQTPAHSYPTSFYEVPISTNLSGTKASVIFTDKSTCTPSAGSTCTYTWVYGDGKSCNDVINTTCQETNTHAYTSSTDYTYHSSLTLCDPSTGIGTGCCSALKDVKVRSPASVPIWSEVSPF